MLKLIRKNITTEQIEKAFAWTRAAGIMTSGFVMIGSHPSETVEDLDQTLRFMKRLKPDFMMVYIAVPFPGTELYRMMYEKNMIFSDDWNEFDIVRCRPVWRTENFSPDDLVAHQQRLYRSFYLRPGFIIKKILDLRSKGDVKYLFESGMNFIKYVFEKRKTNDQSM